ncbi:uncharacterized protein B0I36DRAFT_140559 [Microdochium trichocladiopsis]|uniref:Uncharacterized protein n=1 Tax=Microdochium trichocladiopsis TaxID=1682393 RepID=A0A9P8Y444_9PEZI|nr:uncharacterized protein B0I36DRAFT_140559 [Microdochium trichocladiopsis]KAH7027582.1 hypothetical protein B0I36DRAFT_140559 [Microdochium trichocladiopsis]
MQRIHNQVASASMKTGSLDSSSSESSAALPLRVRRASNHSAAPVGSSQIPVQSAKRYKDSPLPSLSIAIPPMPSRPVALAVRDEIPEQVHANEERSQSSAVRHQTPVDREKADAGKMVTFAADQDENDLSDQTSICQSPTWDSRKKKKAKPIKAVKGPKVAPSPVEKNGDGSTSPTKKKGRRLSKQPPTPGPQVRSVTKAELSKSATRFDLEDIETQAPQNKALRTRPPDAMKHPELHQSGNVSDSNDKPRSKGFFSRIRRLSFDESSKSPRSPAEQVVPPPLVQKSHSSGPGTGLGFFSSLKPQSKDASKASSPRSQSALGSHPPVTTHPSSAGRGRSNSLLSATLEKIKGAGQKTSSPANGEDITRPQNPSETQAENASTASRAKKSVEDNVDLPFDLQPPPANFSQKPRSYSSDSLASQGTTTSASKKSESNTKGSASARHDPYQPAENADESEFGSLSTLRLSQLPPSELALKSARSAEFETASIQESIFNVVKLEDRSSDYLNFINDSYTPPLLELVTPVEGRSSPMRPTSTPKPVDTSYRAREQRAAESKPHGDHGSRTVPGVTHRTPTAEPQQKQASSATLPLEKSPALERFGQSWNAGPEPSVIDISDLSAPAPLTSPKGHSRTASEKSSSSLYDESTPTPSTPATPDSVQPQHRQDVHPALRSGPYSREASEGHQIKGNAERRPRNALRTSSQETARPSADRSTSRERRTPRDSWNKAASVLGLEPPPANFFSRADGNGSNSSLASSPSSIKSASAIKAEMATATKQAKEREREMPPRAQSAIDLSSTSFLPPLKHQPLATKKKQRPSATAMSVSPLESADEESISLRPKASRSSSANSQESGTVSSSGAAYLEEARKAVQPISAVRALRAPFAHNNSSATSVKTTQSGRGEPIAKMLVECCSCKFFHDMPSKVYECMAKPDSIVEDKKLGVSAAVTTMVRCPWCGHGMSTQCCAGYAAVLFLKEKLHGK